MTETGGRALRFGAIAAIAAVTALIGVLAILFVLLQPWLPGHFETGNDGHFNYITSAGAHWRDPVITSAQCLEGEIRLDDHDLDVSGDLFSPPDPARYAGWRPCGACCRRRARCCAASTMPAGPRSCRRRCGRGISPTSACASGR
ncbi:MAG: hypothetical protein WDN06_14555, partial [Asticcacaulis sp.]